jgi:uncharacterized membrane protein YjjP (DUF1212 family)
MAQSLDRDELSSSALSEIAEVVLRFGAALTRAGQTAFRVREWMGVLAHKMGLRATAVSITFNSITASFRRGSESAVLVREIEPPVINAFRISALEQLAQTVGLDSAPPDIATKLAEIEATAPAYSPAQIAVAISAACGGFAFLNGAGILEVIAAAIAGAVGQGVRGWLSRGRLTQYGVTALCALVASALYSLVAWIPTQFGLSLEHHTTGLFASVLFLIPGFPLVAALLDLLQYQAAAAVTRFAHCAMILLAATFGLSVVIAAIGLDMTRPPLELEVPLKLFLRAIASFAGGCGFAMLYNSAPRTVLAVGLLALGANELRLGLHDAGMRLAPATFFGSLAVGLLASRMIRTFKEPRIAITVPGIIVMIPGVYAYQMIVLFNQGRTLDALQAATSFGFVVGAMAMGLAVARFLSQHDSSLRTT